MKYWHTSSNTSDYGNITAWSDPQRSQSYENEENNSIVFCKFCSCLTDHHKRECLECAYDEYDY